MKHGTAVTANVRLRPATPSDAAAIAEVWHAGWADGHLGHVPAGLVAHRRRADFDRLAALRVKATTVAVADDAIVGFATVVGDELEQIYVAPAARGCGAAATLLRHAEMLVARRGVDVAWLAVADGNARARRFYEREGWHDAGPITYLAEVDAGRFEVPCRRYERVVGHAAIGQSGDPS